MCAHEFEMWLASPSVILGLEATANDVILTCTQWSFELNRPEHNVTRWRTQSNAIFFALDVRNSRKFSNKFRPVLPFAVYFGSYATFTFNASNGSLKK